MRLFIFLLVLLAALSVPANAVNCTVDYVPAATLLLPYFEGDLTVPVGSGTVETIVVVRNAAPKAVATNVVVWSDEGVPVLAFPIVLPAYGSYDFSLDNLVATGDLPESFPGNFSGCQSLLPVHLTSAQLQHLQNALTGRASALLGGKCAGLSLPGRPNIAHGYITVDVVKDCTTKIPGDAGYFAKGGTGIATDTNYLFGTSLYRDTTLPLDHAEPLVAVEAFPNQFAPKTYTFYGSLLTPQWSGADDREPLATNFGAGFAIGGFFAGTELFVWRDPRQPRQAFTCGSPPAALDQNFIQAIGKTDGILHRVTPVPPPFGAVAQRVAIGGPALPIPSSVGDFGWLFLNLGHRKGVPTDNTAVQRRVAQGWVTILTRTAPPPPFFSAGTEAVRFDSACKGLARPNADRSNP